MFNDFNIIKFPRKSFLYNKTSVFIILLISILFSFVLWFAVKNYYDNLNKERFETSALENINQLDKRMSSYKNVLQSGIGFFRGSKSVDKEEWHAFVDAINLKENYPGIQGIGFSKMLTPDEVAPIEKKMRDEGFVSFLVNPTGKRKQYSSILYLEPLDVRNLQAIGYDMFSEPVRHAAMDMARDTGLPSVSGKVTLVQEIDTDVQPGMLMYLPLYKKGAKADTLEERRAALVGFIYSAFRMNDLMDKLVLKKSVLNFEIYDSPIMSDEHLLYRSFIPSSYISKYHVHKTLKIYNRTWDINLFSTKQFDLSVDNFYPLMMTILGVVVYFILLLIILTLIKSRHLLFFQANELLKLSQAIEQSPLSIVLTNLEGNIEYVNDAFTTITGYTKSEVMGKNPRLLQSGKTPTGKYLEMWKALTSGQNWHGEFTNARKDKTEYIESIRVSPIFQTDGQVSQYLAIKEDITEKKHSEERIDYLANFDLLTGLPNRFQLEKLINYSINMAKRNDDQFAVIFLDLDRFKDINDTLGHKVGDDLLIELAKRFQSVLREVDTVSRLGGDEFIFLLFQTDTNRIQYLLKRMLDLIAQPFHLNGNELIVTASIGIALYPIDGTDFQTLSKNADIAMYRAKQEGRNRYCFFTESLQKQLARNLQLTNALHHALERNELYVVYQPQISTKNERIIGAEALLRWKHPEFGDISPMEFIPLAEESGLILPIGEWVLRTAVSQVRSLMEQKLDSMIIAVNLSAVQFRQLKLPELVQNILSEAEVPAEYIELELTEAVAMQDPQSAYKMMDHLHTLGIRMSIDDFGTGYSSLSYLKKFKVYKLKIDQSFVHDIGIDKDDRAIVTAIIKMAHSLGLVTIAEGVETLEQLNYLREQGCDEIQGYYYSKPLIAEEFEKFIKNHHSIEKQ